MARLLFVGQAPSAETIGKPPMSGRSGELLAELLGMEQEKMLLAHEFVNLLDEYPGRARFGKGDAFPMPAARAAAEEMREKLRGKATVLLGNNVAKAFGIKEFQYCQWYSLFDRIQGKTTTGVVAIIPHPSGVNRWYNYPQRRTYVSQFLRLAASSKEY